MHSGHAWLWHLLEDNDAFQNLQTFSKNLANLMFQTRHGKQRPQLKDIAVLHSQPEGGTHLPHTGRYYEMSTYRIAKHALACRTCSHGGRPLCPSCELSQDLWLERLLDRGAKAGAKKFGLLRYEDALSFVTLMQRVVPGYCFCDFACFLCLAK